MYTEEIKEAAIDTIKTQALVNQTFGTESREAKFFNNGLEESLVEVIRDRENFEIEERIADVVLYEAQRIQTSMKRPVVLRLDVEIKVTPEEISATKTEITVRNAE